MVYMLTIAHVATSNISLIDLVYLSIITNINYFNINLRGYFNYIIYRNSKTIYTNLDINYIIYSKLSILVANVNELYINLRGYLILFIIIVKVDNLDIKLGVLFRIFIL